MSAKKCLWVNNKDHVVIRNILFQVKILVPNSTAGMIIGKGGNYIKQIKEQSGSYVQISQKAKEVSLQERCITVVGKTTSLPWAFPNKTSPCTVFGAWLKLYFSLFLIWTPCLPPCDSRLTVNALLKKILSIKEFNHTLPDLKPRNKISELSNNS